MPVLDLPLADLERYTGRNPRPADFDAFWDRSLVELAEVDPETKREPALFRAPHVDCFHLWFTGTGGARIHAKLVLPKGAQNAPAVVQFHGYTGRSGDWSELMGYAGAGLVVAALDCRGQAGRSQDTVVTKGPTQHGHIIRGLSDDDPRQLYYRNVFLDAARLVQIVQGMPEVDGARVATYGGSQGGGLAVAAAALEPSASRCVSWFPFLSDYQRVWEMDLDQHAYGELRTYFRHFDPRHEHEAEIFTRLGYIDVHHLASRVRAETLMFVGLLDNITPPSTVYAVFNHLGGPKEMKVYPDFGHDGLPESNDFAFQFLCRS